jgi:hypothetical protein
MTKGRRWPFSREMPETERLDTIRSLDPDRFDEIHAAIEKHEEAYAAEQAKKKKTLGYREGIASDLPSPVAVALALSLRP